MREDRKQGRQQNSKATTSSSSEHPDSDSGSESNLEVESKFTTLHSLGGLFKVLGIFNLLAAVIGGFYVGSTALGVGGGILVFLMAGLGFVICMALAEIVKVLPAIERNTRKIAKVIET